MVKKKNINDKNTVKVLCETYDIKKEINRDTGNVSKVILEGIAITFDKPTRNGVMYTYNSGVQAHKSLIGKPFLDSHHDDSIREYPPYGHVIETFIVKENGYNCLKYQVDLDPLEDSFIRKVKRGDIPGVSIQVMVDEADEIEINNEPVIKANITEYLELSAVLIPGDGDTSLRFVETFKKEQKMGGTVNDTRSDEEEKEKEELGTDNSDGLVNDGIAKKIKKEPEEKEAIQLNPKTGLPKDREDDIEDKDEETEFEYGNKKIVYTRSIQGLLCLKCSKKELLMITEKNGKKYINCLKCGYIHKENSYAYKKKKLDFYKNRLVREYKKKIGGK